MSKPHFAGIRLRFGATFTLCAALVTGCTGIGSNLSDDQQQSVNLAEKYLEQGPHSRERLEERVERAGEEPLSAAGLDVLGVGWSEQALTQAQEYLEEPMSEELLRRFLRTDRFSDRDIEYAIEHIEEDWGEHATRMLEERWTKANITRDSAKRYLKYRYFSEGDISFALSNADIDWED